MFLPVSPFGWSKVAAWMMQRWPGFHGSLSLAFASSSSLRALFVGTLSFGSLAKQAIRPHGPSASSRP